MFTQKRKNYKTFLYAVVILLLCFLILALAWPQDVAESEVSGNLSYSKSEDIGDLKGNSVEEREPGEDDLQHGSDNNPTSDQSNKKNTDNSKETDMNSSADSYYLVKRADGAVKIFFVNGEGDAPVELETTNILYDVLGPDDQKLFDEGYRVKTQDELAVLLQDFES